MWKQRLYAFLLRRILGPYLDADSNQKLHESIDVSLQEGRFTLVDVGLDALYLTRQLQTVGVAVRSVCIQKLEIHLSLVEHTQNPNADDDDNPTSSLAWRALKLGATSTSPSVSLVASIQIQGVRVELEPSPIPPSTAANTLGAWETPSEPSDGTAPPQPKSRMAMYMEAALSSLRLSLALNDVTIKLCQQDTWVAAHLTALSYHDKKDQKTREESATVLSKVLEMGSLTCQVGREASTVTTIARVDGTGQITLRAVECRSDEPGTDPVRSLVQNDLEVHLHQRFNVSVDVVSLQRVQTIATGFQARPLDENSAPVLPAAEALPQEEDDDADLDEEDLSTMDAILRQYKEARRLVEHNELRGGILVPSTEDGDNITFDAFFDANEQSFSHYTSVLKESIMAGPEDGPDGDFVHTKIRFHLAEGGIKLNFQRDNEPAYRRHDEYLILTFSDLDASSSISKRKTDASLSILHLDIEDSQLDQTLTASASSLMDRRTDIGSVLRFTLVEEESVEDACAIVSQPPCVNLSVRVEKGGTSKKYDMDITLLPLELGYRAGTMSHLAAMLKGLKQNDAPTPDTTPEKNLPTVNMACSISSVTVTIPILRQLDIGSLYQRSGYIANSARVEGSLLGIELEHVLLERTQSLRGDQPESQTCEEFSFHRLVVFASSPDTGRVVMDSQMQRVDLLVLSGRTEVEPCIPVSFALKTNKIHANNKDNLGRDSFPFIPTISSFKARQEDDDEDQQIDRILSAKLGGLGADTRKGLRGTDQQVAMLSEAGKCTKVLEVNIPELVGDVSVSEARLITKMLEAAIPTSSDEKPSAETRETSSPTSMRLGVSLICDQLSLALHNDVSHSSPRASDVEVFSYLLSVEGCKAHLVRAGSSMKQARFLAHEPNFFEVKGLLQENPRVAPKTMQERVVSVRSRSQRTENSSCYPLIFRSKLFQPISQQCPSFLVDLVYPYVGTAEEDCTFTQRNIHITIYHVTHRYDIDSGWIERLLGILVGNGLSRSTNKAEDAGSGLTQLFVSFTDCNIDYSSPLRFNTESRSIVRVGDLRLSSNIMAPTALKQAYSLSVGDVSFHILNSRLSYNEENALLPRASSLMSPGDISGPRVFHRTSGVASETLLREMKFINSLSLDSMDAIIAVSKSHAQTFSERKICDEADVTLSLTFGRVCLFACKDSFECFVGTVSEAQAKLTALTDECLEALKSEQLVEPSSIEDEPVVPSPNQRIETETADKHDDMLSRSTAAFLGEATSDTDSLSAGPEVFLLDGYDWTTIDHGSTTVLEIPPGEEQTARWYTNPGEAKSAAHEYESIETQRIKGLSSGRGDETTTRKDQMPTLIPDYFALRPMSSPLGEGDMGAAKFAGHHTLPSVRARILVHDLAWKLLFFDGYDWPESIDPKRRKKILENKDDVFVISCLAQEATDDLRREMQEGVDEQVSDDGIKERLATRAKLMGDLLDDPAPQSGVPAQTSRRTFEGVPLPEERGAFIAYQQEMKRLARRTGRFFQVTATGVCMRMDSFKDATDHRLSSILDLAIDDLFLAETISGLNPVKMLGEWVNEVEHPRDTTVGLIMMKMVTWHPRSRVTAENEVANDECEVTLQKLPLRCLLDQNANRFIRSFFCGDESKSKNDWTTGLHLIPPPLFKLFRVKPCKMKVDYKPRKLDVSALREGSYVELINLSPLDSMVILLQQVDVCNEVGFGAALGVVVRSWVQDICATQMHKFLTNARPFEPLSNVSNGVADLFVLPYEAYKNGEDVKRAVKSGVFSLAGTLVYEALSTTSRITQYAATEMARAVGSAATPQTTSRARSSALVSSSLPSRPTELPRGVGDVGGHALESLARGIQTANYKVVIVPFREYRRTGAKGAVKSIVRGIPVAVVAPCMGATEAISYTLLGARNQVRPDIRKEEEASQKGLQYEA